MSVRLACLDVVCGVGAGLSEKRVSLSECCWLRCELGRGHWAGGGRAGRVARKDVAPGVRKGAKYGQHNGDAR